MDDADPSAANRDQTSLFASIVELLRRHPPEQDQTPAAEQARIRAEFELARQQLEAFHLTHPDSVPALRLLTEVCSRLGDAQRTRAYIQQAERLDPWNPEILIISESLYSGQAGGADVTPGAAPMVDSELRSGAVTTESLIEKAMGSFRLGQLQRAYTLSKLAYRIEPEKGHHLLDVWTVGAALDPERTRRDLVLLEPEQPEQPYLYLALGSIDNVLGLYEEAAGWLERGLSLKLDDPYVHAMLFNELAYVLVRRDEQLDVAVQLARRALELFPDRDANGFIRDTLGLAYLKQGQVDKALRNLREAVAKDATVVPRFHLAIALLGQKETTDALAELRIIAAARPSLESPHIEEIAILDRVQSHIAKIEELLNLGGPDDIQDALAVLAGLI